MFRSDGVTVAHLEFPVYTVLCPLPHESALVLGSRVRILNDFAYTDQCYHLFANRSCLLSFILKLTTTLWPVYRWSGFFFAGCPLEELKDIGLVFNSASFVILTLFLQVTKTTVCRRRAPPVAVQIWARMLRHSLYESQRQEWVALAPLLLPASRAEYRPYAGRNNPLIHEERHLEIYKGVTSADSDIATSLWLYIP